MRANDVLGIIHSQAYDASIRELTLFRTMASVPFGCRYRLIDFPLSNMVNAGITQIGIVTKSNYQSLMDHVGSGKPWDLARKREGMFILPPYNTNSPHGNHESRIESLYSISDFFKKSRHEYVIMTDANAVYNLDFNDIFRFHSEKEADITIVYKHGKVPKNLSLMMFALDNDKRINEISVSQNVDAGTEANYSFNIFLMRKSLLEYLVRTAVAHSTTASFERDVMQANLQNLKIYGYEATGFAEIIDSLSSYYKANMDLLLPDNRKTLFDTRKPIVTKTSDNVPTTYGLDCNVSNSLIADGCVINGTVENSILFRNVHVEKGAVIKNSIIMQGSTIHANSVLNSIITDKNVSITSYKSLSGDKNYPVYIGKGTTV